MTRSHRNEDRGGEHRWTFNGVEYPTRKLMCEARRAEYVRLLDEEGMNFTQAAHAVGVSKRTGKGVAQRQDARHGKERETPGGLVSFHHGQTQDPPSALPEPGGAHPDRGPSASGRFDPRHRPPGWPRPRHGQPRGRAQEESRVRRVTSLTAPSRRPRTGSNAPNRARRPRARDCGTRSPPGCAGIGARSR